MTFDERMTLDANATKNRSYALAARRPGRGRPPRSAETVIAVRHSSRVKAYQVAIRSGMCQRQTFSSDQSKYCVRQRGMVKASVVPMTNDSAMTIHVAPTGRRVAPATGLGTAFVPTAVTRSRRARKSQSAVHAAVSDRATFRELPCAAPSGRCRFASPVG